MTPEEEFPPTGEVVEQPLMVFPEFTDPEMGMPQAVDPSTPVEQLLVGDTVNAFKNAIEADPYEAMSGVITAISGTEVSIGSVTKDAADGWQFVITARPLTFPTKLTEIDAELYSAPGVYRLMGKRLTWTTEDGRTVPTSDIKSYVIAPDEEDE